MFDQFCINFSSSPLIKTTYVQYSIKIKQFLNPNAKYAPMLSSQHVQANRQQADSVKLNCGLNFYLLCNFWIILPCNFCLLKQFFPFTAGRRNKFSESQIQSLSICSKSKNMFPNFNGFYSGLYLFIFLNVKINNQNQKQITLKHAKGVEG